MTDVPRLVGEYVDQTSHHSTYQMMRKAPAHDLLVAEGERAVTPLLEALERDEGGMCLMFLLRTLTGEWPSAAADERLAPGWLATNVTQASYLWVEWGRANGYLDSNKEET